MARAGRSLSPNYQTVLDVIEHAGPGTHLSAYQIWERARKVKPRIGFATVHRGLARLHGSGGIMKIDLPGEASTFYEPLSHAHAHFRCSSCGSLKDLAYEVPTNALAELGRRHDCTIDDASVYFSGRCAGCS
ncbi:MAG: transcriptional repressor [Candidatus Eremiobacteraeota bacterium]|nr:transcriptional repressor [Candidatus Eremiobacteraeota bacterium]